MSGEGGYTRWVPAEWRAIAAHAVPLVDDGKTAHEAVYFAQREVLQAERQKTLSFLRNSGAKWRHTWLKYLAEARKMSESERAALRAPIVAVKTPSSPPPPPSVSKPIVPQLKGHRRGEPEPVYEGGARWTSLEWALIARHVQHRIQQGDRRTVANLIIEAQEICLKPERRRAVGGIRQRDSHQKNAKRIELALKDLWLVEKVPFAPDGVVLNPDTAETTTPAPTQPPEAEGAPFAATHLPPSATAVPGPAPIAVGSVAEAVQLFGVTITQALGSLLKVHAQALLGQVEQAMRNEAQNTANIMLASIERGIKGVVHNALETELGGPVAAPSATVTPVMPEEARRLLRVDVVGLVGQNITEVKRAFNGTTDLKFIDVDQLTAWQPRPERHAILVTKFIPHKAHHKLKSAGVKPILVNGGVGTVIQAIEELHRAAGIEAH